MANESINVRPRRAQTPPQCAMVPASLLTSFGPSTDERKTQHRSNRAKGRKRTWKLPTLFSVKRLSGSFGTLAVLSFALGGGPWKQLDRVMASAGTVAEEVAAATANLIRTGVNFTDHASNVVFSSSSGVLNLIHEAWRGIDLLDVNVTRKWGRVSGESPEDLASWVESTEGGAVINMYNDDRSRFSAAIRSLTPEVLEFETSSDRLETAGSYSMVRLQVATLPSGNVGASWVSTRLTFKLGWANPLWEAFRASFEAESVQIMAMITVLLHELPPINVADLALDEGAVGFHRPQRSWYQHLAALLLLNFKKFAQYLVTTIGGLRRR